MLVKFDELCHNIDEHEFVLPQLCINIDVFLLHLSQIDEHFQNFRKCVTVLVKFITVLVNFGELCYNVSEYEWILLHNVDNVVQFDEHSHNFGTVFTQCM